MMPVLPNRLGVATSIACLLSLLFLPNAGSAWCHIKHREGLAALGTHTPIPVYLHPSMLAGGIVHPDGTQWSADEIVDTVRWTLEMANASALADLTHAPFYYAGITVASASCDPAVDPVALSCRVPGAVIIQRQAEDICRSSNTLADSILSTGTTIQIAQRTFTARDGSGNAMPGTPCMNWVHLANSFSNGAGFEGALLHELGHALGLAHNAEGECDATDRISRCSGRGLVSERCAVMNFGAGQSYMGEGWLPDDLEGLARLREGRPGTIRLFPNVRVYESANGIFWSWVTMAPGVDGEFGANPQGLSDSSAWLAGRDWRRPGSGTQILRAAAGSTTWATIDTVELAFGSPALSASRSSDLLLALQRVPARHQSILRVPVFGSSATGPTSTITTFRPRWADPGLEPELMVVSPVHRQGGISVAYDPVGDTHILLYRDNAGALRLMVFDPDDTINPFIEDYQMVNPATGMPVIAAGPASIVCRPRIPDVSDVGSCLVVWATDSDGPFSREFGYALVGVSPAFSRIDLYEFDTIPTPMHRPPQAALIRDGQNELRFMVAWSRTMGASTGDLSAEIVVLTRQVERLSPWNTASIIPTQIPFDFRVSSASLVSTPPPAGGASSERARIYVATPSGAIAVPPSGP